MLAAGEASRMGESKVTLPYRGSTILETVVSTAADAGLDPIVVVTGFHHEAVVALIGDRATAVHNPDAASGNLTSLKVGVSTIGEVDAAVVLLGDMPGVRVGTVQELVQRVLDTGAAGGWVSYRGDHNGVPVAGHPIVLSRRGLDGCEALTGPKALWRHLTGLAADDVVVLELDENKPIDVNTPEEYRQLLAEEP